MIFGGGTKNATANTEPVRVAILGAAGQIGYSLLPMIARGEMFGPTRRVSLQCLDLNQPAVRENMRGIEMEIQDGNFPLVHEVTFTTDDAVAYRSADYAILLGAFPMQEGRPKRDCIEKNCLIFRTTGHALTTHASPNCKVLVVGHPACTNALICAHYAPSLPKENFFALTRLDHNRALGQIAQHAKVSVGDVRNVIIWGCHMQIPDLDQAEIRGQSLHKVLSKEEDQRWLQDQFLQEIQQRGANIVKARKGSCAMSAASAIVDHIRDLHCGTRSGELVSMGIWSDKNQYGVENGLMYSVPVSCMGQGRYRAVTGLNMSEETRGRMKQAELDLLEDRRIAEEFFEKHAREGRREPTSQ